MSNVTFEEIMAYSSRNQKVFDELAGLCSKNLIVPYIGAGMSVFAGFKTWNDFINIEYEKCFANKKPQKKNNLAAADLIEEKQGKDSFYENVSKTFGGGLNDVEWNDILEKAKSNAVSVIPMLFSGPILTTNFDQIIEKIHNNELPVVFPYHSEQLEKAIENRKRLVYKIHGCVSKAQEVVFTKKVYDEVYSHDSKFVESLSKFFQGFQFLFLGCSLGVNIKEDTKEHYIELWEKLQKSGTYHFAVLNCTKDQILKKREELEERNIHPILYESGKYESVKIILDKLLEKVDSYSLNIPQYTTIYTERGKNVLEQIAGSMADKEYSAVALIGMPGVGKTRILREYALLGKNKQQNTDIIWFNAVSEAVIREEIYRFAVRKKLIDKDEKDRNLINSVFRQWMQNNTDWVFLLDNVDHYEEIEIFFDFDKTLAGKRHILISSRLEEDKLPNIHSIEIEIFRPEEARTFLQSQTGKEPDGASDKIAEKLGGLPLALEQAAAYIKTENISYQKFLSELEKEPFDILEKQHPEPGAVSVRATWNISIQRIKDKSAKQLLNLCAFFAPDNIIDRWFVNSSDILAQSLQDSVKNDILFDRTRTELSRFSLVKIIHDENNLYRKINVHRLLQTVIRDALKDEQEELVDTCVQIMNKELVNLFSVQKTWVGIGELIPHAISIIEKTQKENKEVSDLACFLGNGFDELSYYSEAWTWYQKALTIREKLFTAEHQETAIVYDKIGTLFEHQSMYAEALNWHEKALQINERVLGKEDSVTIGVRINIGLIYDQQGKYEDALDWYKKTLVIQEEKSGRNNADTARIYNHIALVRYHQGYYKEALDLHMIVLSIREIVFAKNNPRIATTFNNIGLVYHELAAYDDALEWYRKSLEIKEDVLGKKHRDTAATYNNIGMTYKEKGDYDEAHKWHQKALTIKEERLPLNDHQSFAITYNNIGEVYNRQGNLTKALQLFKKARTIWEKKLGEEHPETSVAYYNIAEVYGCLDRFEEAMNLYQKALKIREAKLPKNHPDTVLVRKAIAALEKKCPNVKL